MAASSPKPLSIQLYTVRDEMAARDPFAVIQEIADIGYVAVEGMAGGLSPAAYRERLRDMGLQVSSWFGPIPAPENLNEIEDTLRALETPFLTGGFWIQDLESVDAIRATADRLNAAVPQLRERGFRYALHNHWMEFEEREGKLVTDWLLELCPDLELELDIYWASNFGAHRPVDMVERYRDRIALMHVKDGSMVRDDPMLPVGQGKVDVAACIRAAEPAWLIVELDHFAGNMMDAVRESHRYLTENGLAQGRK